MVQVLQGQNRRAPSFAQSVAGNLAESVPQAFQQYFANQRQPQQSQQANERYKELTGQDLSGLPPQAQQQIAQLLLQGQQQQANMGQKLAGQQQEAEQKKQAELEPLQGALDVLSRMKDLRKKGNLGVLASYSPFSSTRKDAGEYSQLGKSLIQYATNIPIRNKVEFETLAEELYNPNITDARAEGILNAMERILQGSLQSAGRERPKESINKVGSKQERKPLSSFIGKK